MFWLRNKKSKFDCAILSGGLKYILSSLVEKQRKKPSMILKRTLSSVNSRINIVVAVSNEPHFTIFKMLSYCIHSGFFFLLV